MSDLPSQESNIETALDGQKERSWQDRIVIVTGMSGAGRSMALKALEDVGYEAVDNLPLSLLGAVVHAAGPTAGELEKAARDELDGLSQSNAENDSPRLLALGVDIRTRDFGPKRLLKQLADLERDPYFDVDLIFIDCDDEILRRRFTETRRAHPLGPDRPVIDGIALERRMLAPLREKSSLMVDTTTMAPADLKRLLSENFDPGRRNLSLFVTSFSYRFGIPREADLVFDMRFLRNPHYVPALKPMTGREKEVQAYISDDPVFTAMFNNLKALLLPLLPRYENEGKSYLTIAVGCTGGRHRSVYVTELLGETLKTAGYDAQISHREL